MFLIYAHDVDAQMKHAIAQDILRELWTRRTGALSTQVLQEFYVNVTRNSFTAIQTFGACDCGQLRCLMRRYYAGRDFRCFPY
jgi:predicted nucleic acid-binding protein